MLNDHDFAKSVRLLFGVETNEEAWEKLGALHRMRADHEAQHGSDVRAVKESLEHKHDEEPEDFGG